jgi:bacteriorhodopsin
MRLGQNLLKYSVFISLFVQVLTGIFTLKGVFVKVPAKDIILTEIITLETIVQFIEGIFYTFIALAINKIDTNLITRRRYLDWFITTPTMLLSTIMFMAYENLNTNETYGNMENKDKNDEPLNLTNFMKKYKNIFIKIAIYNALMLLFGYLGEIGILNIWLSTSIGFVFFYLAFEQIYTNFVKNSPSKENKMLFTFLFIVWGLYGVAAVLPLVPKNIGYNFLDLISKNFYGIYIYFKIMKVAI